MKLSVFQWNRRGRSLDSPFDGGFVTKSSPCSVFWFVIHALCCLISLILGFRFSHLVLFFLFSTSVTNLYTTTLFLSAGNGNNNNAAGVSQLLRLTNNSRVVVGRHGIRIRPWPHPNPIEVMKAHRILDRVQKEQKSLFGVKKSDSKTVIAVTPTYVRTFQALHLTGVMHSLMLVPYDLVWIVVEAGGKSNETASFIAKSRLKKTIHLGFEQKMPNTWEDRHKFETKMRFHALRFVREKKIDGIVVFVDDSNMHSMELFDEIQSVKWFGAFSIGILAHSGNADSILLMNQENKKKKKKNKPSSIMPIQGPKCDDSTEKLIGFRVFDTQPYAKKTEETVMMKPPSKMEWSGFVLNSRLLWKDSDNKKPEWVKDLDFDDEIESPLSLVKDHSMVEPLGNCGRTVLLWWLRVEARADSKFPSQWIIESPLEITVPSKRTPWLDSKSGQRRFTKPREGGGGSKRSKSSKEKQESF